MLSSITTLALLAGIATASSQHHHQRRSEGAPLSGPGLAINGIPASTRVHWMRRANEALSEVLDDPCPFAAFGTAIVNHTAPGLGELVCVGANSNSVTGNPSLHGMCYPEFTHLNYTLHPLHMRKQVYNVDLSLTHELKARWLP